tara:strand:- start:1019 stop:1171 length:153 start_codon:yes stop_codon:yes gene_type:complete
MKTPNKFLLIIISFILAIGLFTFVQYKTNQLVTKAIGQMEKCECEDENKD